MSEKGFQHLLFLQLLLPEPPRLSAHGTLLAHILLRFQPLHHALHVKGVTTLSPDRRAVIARVLLPRAAGLVRIPTYTANLRAESAADGRHDSGCMMRRAHLIVNLPTPDRHTVPFLYLHLHIPGTNR